MKYYKYIGAALLFSLLISGCKKDDDVIDDDLPVFGTCEPVDFTGNLSQSATDKIITYVTSGGGTIKLDGFTFTFTHKDYHNFSIQFWGMTHENLNAKHVKEFLGNRRSLVFPDGTKITVVNTSLNESIKSFSIHDGNEYHHFNFSCKTLEYSATNSPYAQQLDNAEADGETATFEFTATGLFYLNIYTEDTPGKKVEKRVNIGEIYRDDPSRVDDSYP